MYIYFLLASCMSYTERLMVVVSLLRRWQLWLLLDNAKWPVCAVTIHMYIFIHIYIHIHIKYSTICAMICGCLLECNEMRSKIPQGFSTMQYYTHTYIYTEAVLAYFAMHYSN